MQLFYVLTALLTIGCSQGVFKGSSENRKTSPVENTGESGRFDPQGSPEAGNTNQNSLFPSSNNFHDASPNVRLGLPSSQWTRGGTSVFEERIPRAALLEKCRTTSGTTIVEQIDFPARGECSWGIGQNLPKSQGRLQAQEVQRASNIILPPGALICSLEIESVGRDLQYDDFVILTLEEYALVVSNSELVGMLPRAGDAVVWDFMSVRGKSVNFEAMPYCHGSNNYGNCVFPPHDRKGPLDLTFDSERLAGIATRVAGEREIDFSLYATGDNDLNDCQHTDFSMKVSIVYVK